MGEHMRKAGRPGLVAKKVPVQRNGKTVYQIRWSRPGEDEKKPVRGSKAPIVEYRRGKPDKPRPRVPGDMVEDKGAKPTKGGAKPSKGETSKKPISSGLDRANKELDDLLKHADDGDVPASKVKSAVQAAKDAVDDARTEVGPRIPEADLQRIDDIASKVGAIEPGQSKTMNGVHVRRFGQKAFGLVVHGKRLVVRGVQEASLIVDHMGQMMANVAAAAAGDASGASVRGGSIARAGQAVATATEKAGAPAEKALAKLAKRPKAE